MDDEALTRLRHAISRLARQLGRDSAGEGLTPTQALTLGAIAGRGPLSLTELVRTEGLHPAQLSRVVGALEREGLITRTPDPQDLRSVVAAVTEAGRQVATRIRERRAAILAEAVATLTPNEERTVAAAIPVLESLVKALVPAE